MPLVINFKNLGPAIKVKMTNAAYSVTKRLTEAAAKEFSDQVKAMANKELHNRKKAYLSNFKKETLDRGMKYIFTLKGPAVWIESGLKGRQLRQTQLNGKPSRVIPIMDGPLDAAGQKHGGKPRFRTMSETQMASMWKTKALEGVKIFQKALKVVERKLKQKAL